MRPVVAATLAGLLLVTTSCTTGSAASGQPAEPDELRVLAAASLTDAFTELAEVFESDHPGVQVSLAFDSSATLAEQVTQGAPADVLATADARTMQRVTDAVGTATEPQAFASNRVVLVVPAANPAGIDGFAALDGEAVDYLVCVESAPCGALARQALDAADITADPASEEVDVRAVLTKVALGEADAGIVYASDAVAAGAAVRTLSVPASAELVTPYPVAALAEARAPDLAADWVDLLLSVEGQRVLRGSGFGAP